MRNVAHREITSEVYGASLTLNLFSSTRQDTVFQLLRKIETLVLALIELMQDSAVRYMYISAKHKHGTNKSE